MKIRRLVPNEYSGNRQKREKGPRKRKKKTSLEKEEGRRVSSKQGDAVHKVGNKGERAKGRKSTPCSEIYPRFQARELYEKEGEIEFLGRKKATGGGKKGEWIRGNSHHLRSENYRKGQIEKWEGERVKNGSHPKGRCCLWAKDQTTLSSFELPVSSTAGVKRREGEETALEVRTHC